MNSYFSRLDHLRFFAAFWVILKHFGGGEMPHSITGVKNVVEAIAFMGSSGVSLFLVLSGFLFCVISEGGNRKIEYSKFIKNRILRIFPLLVFIVFIFITVNRAKSTPMDIFRVLTLQLNTGHKLSGWVYGIFPIHPIWTIAVEFQFYLIFPFIAIFLKKHGVKYIFGLILLLELTKFSIIIIKGNEMNIDLYCTIIGRLNQILTGMLFGMIYLKFKDRFYNRILPQILIFFTAIIISCTLFYFFINSMEAIRYSIIFFLDEALIFGSLILCYLTVNIKIPQKLDVFLAWLGKLSFSMYLIHMIVGYITYITLAKLNIADRSVWVTIIVILPLTVIISALTYYIIERPFLSMKVKYLK